jgi:DNA-binding transcriptional MerR regulator/predicted transcriptional regulator YdeE
MFSIGEFASIGRVSVRMLRHYDEIGLLVPARVDPHTGYRYYSGGQFAVLGQILAYKELGLRLEEVTRVVCGDVDGDALHELLVRRRAELARQLDLDAARLRRLEAHLRLLRGESRMSIITTELKGLPSLHVARATATAAGFGSANISPVIGPLFDRLHRDLVRAGVRPDPLALASYEASASGDGADVLVEAAFPVPDDVSDGDGFAVVDLPAVELAVTTIHSGPMSTIDDSWRELLASIEEHGYEPAGVCRELYLVSKPEPQESWVTELQQPVSARTR